MEIKLSSDLAAIVKGDVAVGRFTDAEDYVAQAIEMLHEHVGWRNETLNEMVEAGLADEERGELVDEDEVRREMEKVKSEFIRRKSAA